MNDRDERSKEYDRVKNLGLGFRLPKGCFPGAPPGKKDSAYHHPRAPHQQPFAAPKFIEGTNQRVSC